VLVLAVVALPLLRDWATRPAVYDVHSLSKPEHPRSNINSIARFWVMSIGLAIEIC